MAAVLSSLTVIAPVVLAGIVHSIFIRYNLFPQMAQPLDGGARLWGEPVLGSHKTFRGVIIMVAATALAAWAFAYVVSAEWLPRGLEFMGQPLPAAVLGALMGLGYSFGELPNSFIKRRLRIAPGARPAGGARFIGYLADQIDSAIGVVVVLWIAYAPPLNVLLSILTTGTLVHIGFDQCLYLFRVKRRVTDGPPAPA